MRLPLQWHEATRLLQQCTTLPHLRQAHAHLIKTSLDSCHVIIGKFLRRCFSQSNPDSLHYGESLFFHFPNPDPFLWNTLIAAFLRSGQPFKALRLFRRMRRRRPSAAAVDSFGASLAVQACAACRHAPTGGNLHGLATKLGFSADVFVQTALLEFYSKVRDISRARQVFDEMPTRDTVAHNVMLGEYFSHGETAAARQLFDEMPDRDLVSWNVMIQGLIVSGDLAGARLLFDRSPEKDSVTFISMISAYSRSNLSGDLLSLLSTSDPLHFYINQTGTQVDLKLGTSLLDMYSKCGDIESAITIFSKMKEKDVFSWSAMISALANHGRAEAALNLFSEMLSNGVDPNESTFLGLLSACNHAGMVAEARAFFSAMTQFHKISPSIEHYGCLVDLLGRSGHLQEAKDLIFEMPMKPDAVIWRSLLSSCRVHENLEIAREAAMELKKIEQRVGDGYVVFCNVLAQERVWDGVAEARKMMRENGVRKIPGSSLIFLDGGFHVFLSHDRSHPRSEEIYSVLEDLLPLKSQQSDNPDGDVEPVNPIEF